jgi:endonuclease YncB( thermonuclease family)
MSASLTAANLVKAASLLIFSLLLVSPAGAGAFDGSGAPELAGRASVIDGDTLEIHGTRIRLHGIDAPEKRQPCYEADGAQWNCGQAAAMELDAFIADRPVICQPITTDRYGRTVAKCAVNGQDIEQHQVSKGLAWAYRKYSMDYVETETKAAANHIGIWRGFATPAWEWRHAKRSSNPFDHIGE